MADLLHGIDVAVEEGLADNECCVSFCLSGGGYLTSRLLAQASRLKAGIAECPVTDWHGMLGSDIHETIAVWMSGNPGHGEQDMAPYARVAPSTYAANCSTPLLIIVHESDLRCPPSRVTSYITSFSSLVDEVEMRRIPGVGHSPYDTNSSVRRDRRKAIMDWINCYVPTT